MYNEYNDKKLKYKGYFKEGKFDGFGQLYDDNGNLIYEGFFKKNEFNGRGTFYKNKIKEYEGNFINDKYHGIGIEYLSNGKRRRKAFYSEDKIKKNRYGILYNENDEEIYVGPLLDGIPKKGKSIIIYSEDDNNYILYKGNFESFKYNGKGTLYFENGYIYEENKIKFDGIFRNNDYLEGILYNRSGFKEYEGEFKENK